MTILVWHRANFWTWQEEREMLKEISEVTCYIIFSKPLQSRNVFYWDSLWSDLSTVRKIFYALRVTNVKTVGIFVVIFDLLVNNTSNLTY